MGQWSEPYKSTNKYKLNSYGKYVVITETFMDHYATKAFAPISKSTPVDKKIRINVAVTGNLPEQVLSKIRSYIIQKDYASLRNILTAF